MPASRLNRRQCLTGLAIVMAWRRHFSNPQGRQERGISSIMATAYASLHMASHEKAPIAVSIELTAGTHGRASRYSPNTRSLLTELDMAARKKPRARRNPKRWSADVTKRSNALDLDRGVFTWKDPRRIAASLKRSADTSTRRKAGAYRSALSMLTFHINRAGTNLPAAQKKVLEKAKSELRKTFGRKTASR